MTVEFVEELPPRRDVGKQSPWRAELRARPGKWAKVKVIPRGTKHTGVNQLSGFETTTRTIDGQRVVYARYVGNDSNP